MNRHGLGYDRVPRPSYAVDLIPLDEMVARIEAIRAEEALSECPSCGPQARKVIKRCVRCSEIKPASAFGIDRRYGTPRSYCRPCQRQRTAELRRRQALRVLGVAS